ncbi:MAG: LicD family protein [Oscillospiraceae bacterium]|nr:LicD family protein [Oscillospiraceae bacterium]MBQ8612568.1 LicD family protein [Oscillospiraceae bacterium]
MEIDARQLNALKSAELEMLQAFIEVCEKLELNYYLLGGTLLGAVRHQGFIPWDDDIDVGMLRKDYEKFVREGQKYLPEHIFLQHYNTDPAYPMNFVKLRNSRTAFIETSVRKLKMNHGVFLDVFPLDRCETAEKRKWFERMNAICRMRIAMVFDLKRDVSLRGKVSGVVLKLLFPRVSSAVKLREKLHCSMPDGPLVANFCGAWGVKEIVPATWYGQPRELYFEGMRVKAPAEYEKWLTQVYGDYMQLPPEEKRVTHHYTEVIDMEHSYFDYVKNENGRKEE